MKRLKLLVLLTLSINISSFSQTCTPSDIGGKIFRDYNYNGVLDSGEVGVAGATISAYDENNNLITSSVSSSILANKGEYLLNLTAGQTYRIETTNIPAHLVTGTAGNTTSFIVTADGNCTKNVSLANPAEYCSDREDTQIATSCFIQDNHIGSANEVLVSFNEDGSRNSYLTFFKNVDPIAQGQDAGAIWGLDYSKSLETLYSAAFIKRHADLGPTQNPTTIYKTELSSGLTVPFATIDATRTNPHTGNTDSCGWLGDFGAYDKVFKEGLSDVEIAEDENSLYTIDLKTRELINIGINPDGTSGTITKTDLLSLINSDINNIKTQCTDASGVFAADDVRPFAVETKDGLVYIGAVCSAETSKDDTKVHAYVFTFNGSNLSEFIDFSMNVNRDETLSWIHWDDSRFYTAGHDYRSYDGILADIEFDGDDLVLGFMDRMSQQYQDTGYVNDCSTYLPSQVNAGGDIVRVCQVAANQYVPEVMYSGDSRCSSAGLSSSSEDEYYFEDHWDGTFHPDVAIGGLLQIPGREYILSNTYDPFSPDYRDKGFSGGVRYFNNDDGSWHSSYLLYEGDPSLTFGKAAGLGNLVAICPEAPIQIGNYVWNDLDGDGVQDPNEPPLAGVVVYLYDSSGSIVGQAVTDINGNYYFGGVNDDNMLFGPLNPNTMYEIRIKADDPALNGLYPTENDTSNNIHDSDGVFDNGFIVHQISTGNPGENDHTFDFGFNDTPSDNNNGGDDEDPRGEIDVLTLKLSKLTQRSFSIANKKQNICNKMSKKQFRKNVKVIDDLYRDVWQTAWMEIVIGNDVSCLEVNNQKSKKKINKKVKKLKKKINSINCNISDLRKYQKKANRLSKKIRKLTKSIDNIQYKCN